MYPRWAPWVLGIRLAKVREKGSCVYQHRCEEESKRSQRAKILNNSEIPHQTNETSIRSWAAWCTGNWLTHPLTKAGSGWHLLDSRRGGSMPPSMAGGVVMRKNSVRIWVLPIIFLFAPSSSLCSDSLLAWTFGFHKALLPAIYVMHLL